jgi:hypothetical protein
MGMLGKLKGAAALAKQAYEVGATQSAGAQIAGKVLQGPAGRHVHGIEKAPKPPPRIEDDAEWERVMRADLAVRDAAREPYLAPERSPLRISRFVAGGAEDVARHLAASGLAGRPGFVYGVYRVPDRVGGIVEWDVVHAGPGRMERTLDRVTDVVSVFDGDVYPTGDFLAPRYCWPPA